MRVLPGLLAALLAFAGLSRAQLLAPASMETSISDGRFLLVQFKARSCQICSDQDEALGRISQDKVSWVPAVVQVSMDADPQAAQRHGVSVPGTIILFAQGRELSRAPDLVTEDQIRQFVGMWASRARGRPGSRAKRDFRPKR
jgi:thioredoxin-like negative regulator of GroEL